MTVKYDSISDLRTSEKLLFSIGVNYKNLMHVCIIRKGCSYLLIDLAINLSLTYDNIEARVEEYNYSWFVEHVEMVFSGFQKNNNNLNITTNRKSVAVKSYTS